MVTLGFVQDKELLAAIGEVVVMSAVLDYSVAVLVAMTDGYRYQECEEHARVMVRSPGGAMRELRKRACAQLRGQGVPLHRIARRLRVAQEFSFDRDGRMLTVAEKAEKCERAVRDDLARWERERHDAVPRARCNLMDRWQDAITVLDDRHVIAHSVALEDIEVQGQGGMVIWHPRSGRETQITTSEVRSHLQDILIAWSRFCDAVAAESSADPSGA
jgi:hypothetical protein